MGKRRHDSKAIVEHAASSRRVIDALVRRLPRDGDRGRGVRKARHLLCALTRGMSRLIVAEMARRPGDLSERSDILIKLGDLASGDEPPVDDAGTHVAASRRCRLKGRPHLRQTFRRWGPCVPSVARLPAPSACFLGRRVGREDDGATTSAARPRGSDSFGPSGRENRSLTDRAFARGPCWRSASRSTCYATRIKWSVGG